MKWKYFSSHLQFIQIIHVYTMFHHSWAQHTSVIKFPHSNCLSVPWHTFAPQDHRVVCSSGPCHWSVHSRLCHGHLLQNPVWVAANRGPHLQSADGHLPGAGEQGVPPGGEPVCQAHLPVQEPCHDVWVHKDQTGLSRGERSCNYCIITQSEGHKIYGGLPFMFRLKCIIFQNFMCKET